MGSPAASFARPHHTCPAHPNKEATTIVKKMLSIAVSAAFIAGLAACGSAGTSSSSDASAPGPSALSSAQGVTDITIWHGLGAKNGVAFEKLITEFNEANKGKIHVTSSYQGVYADLLAKYTAGIRSNSTPTVLLAGDIATGYLTDVQKSVPAADMAKANPGDLNLGDITAAGKNYYTVNGTLQSVPMNMSTPVLWVNEDLLAQAGIPSGTDLSTLSAVAAAAKTVTAKTGQKGFTQADDNWYIEQLTAAAGQDFCSPDNGRKGEAPTGVSINGGKAKDAINILADLYTSGVGLPGAADGAAAVTGFQAGKVALMVYSSGIAGTLKTGTNFKYKALPYPISGPKDTSGTVIGGASLWLSSTATKAQQVAGWKLETFLTSPAAQEEFSHATGYVPVNTKVESSDTQKAYVSANPNFEVFQKQISNALIEPQTAGCVTGAMTSIRAATISQVVAAFSGAKPVDTAMDQAASDSKTAIQKYKEQLGK